MTSPSDLALVAASTVALIASQAQRHFPRVQSSDSFFLWGEYNVGHKDDFRDRELRVRAGEIGTGRVYGLGNSMSSGSTGGTADMVNKSELILSRFLMRFR